VSALTDDLTETEEYIWVCLYLELPSRTARHGPTLNVTVC